MRDPLNPLPISKPCAAHPQKASPTQRCITQGVSAQRQTGPGYAWPCVLCVHGVGQAQAVGQARAMHWWPTDKVRQGPACSIGSGCLVATEPLRSTTTGAWAPIIVVARVIGKRQLSERQRPCHEEATAPQATSRRAPGGTHHSVQEHTPFTARTVPAITAHPVKPTPQAATNLSLHLCMSGAP